MRHAVPLIFLGLAAAGCTSLQPVQIPDEELHLAIRAGTMVGRGDRIHVIGSDGTEHAMKVHAVDDHALHGTTKGGADVEVAIDDLVAMSTREFSVFRTALLPVGAVGSLFLMVLFGFGPGIGGA